MQESAFRHSQIRPILEEVKKNAVRYTVNKNRNGIKKTTSPVDNFLKIVKRKLRQVESFRDRHMTGILFRAMANVRNSDYNGFGGDHDTLPKMLKSGDFATSFRDSRTRLFVPQGF